MLKKPNNIGVELLTIESLIARRNNISHNPEKGHQVAFNMIVMYTNGMSKQLVGVVLMTHSNYDISLLTLL
jgi:AraC family transcriptional activator of pobA